MTDPRDTNREPDKPEPELEFTAGFYWYAAFMVGGFLWASIRMIP